jgi:hypothetical protein
MPNWVSIRLTLSGPEYEIRRFANTCVRIRRGEEHPSFDFDALVPMPDAIIRTLDGSTQDLQHQARMATGYDGWSSWCRAFWGSKWNCCDFRELVREPERYACAFATAWSYPEPILQSLALQYPSLVGQIFAAEPGNEWGYVGFLSGSHTGVEIPISRRLAFLVFDADVDCCFPAAIPTEPPHIIEALRSTGMMADVFGPNSEDEAQKRVSDTWLAAHAHLSKEQLAYLQMVEDIDGFVEWLELTDRTENALSPSWDEAQEAIGAHVESLSNLKFITDQRRCATTVDRQLLQAVGGVLRQATQSPLNLEQDGRRLIAPLIERHEEQSLDEWASTAVVRPGLHLNMSDADTLNEGVYDAGVLLLHQAIEHVRTTLGTNVTTLGTNVRSSGLNVA